MLSIVPDSGDRRSQARVRAAGRLDPVSEPEAAVGEAERSGAAETDPVGWSAAELILEEAGRERDRDRRNLRLGLLVALLFHAVVLVIHFPELALRQIRVERPGKVYVVSQARFKPPPPPTGQKQTPKPKKKRIPIPDPTPDDPEPILAEEIEIPEDAFPEVADVVFGIPGPPEGGLGTSTGGGDGSYQIGGGIKPPVKILYSQPRYTEEARKARIQGIVILQCVVDVNGNVTQVQLVKGLTLGLSESAIETVKQWKYKPATLDGEPVPVYYLIRVGFWLQ